VDPCSALKCPLAIIKGGPRLCGEEEKRRLRREGTSSSFPREKRRSTIYIIVAERRVSHIAA
jgi:hypothetical protein